MSAFVCFFMKFLEKVFLQFFVGRTRQKQYNSMSLCLTQPQVHSY